MSSCVIVTPLIIAGWPVISAAVTAAVGSLGYSIVLPSAAVQTDATAKTRTRAEIDIDDSEVLQETGAAGGQIVVERDGIRALFSRDARGALKLCVEGDGHTKAELKKIGEELIGRVTQQYAYHKIVTELQQRNMSIVDEQVSADRTVKIRVRNL
ncbi:MAG TPA: DUF1257 domain-containing protein [Phycisphaerae bacterium]|nr:DUF1257 domain-containing protein [Phycisphaerae bacterium]